MKKNLILSAMLFTLTACAIPPANQPANTASVTLVLRRAVARPLMDARTKAEANNFASADALIKDAEAAVPDASPGELKAIGEMKKYLTAKRMQAARNDALLH